MKHVEPSNAHRMAGLSVQERHLIDSLVAREVAAVGAEHVIELFGISRSSANQILSRLCRKGWLQRVKRGVYAVVPLGSSSPEPAVEDAWPLAEALFAPCFISGWSAAEHWDLTEQIFNSVSVVTGKRQRRSLHRAAGVTFRTRSLGAGRLFGAKRIWLGSRRIKVADPHRLVIDILDDPTFGGGGRHTVDVVREYWRSPHASPDRLLDYARRFGRGTVFKRLGFLSETFSSVSTDWLDECRDGISSGVSLLDPAGSRKGGIVTRWNLRINLPMDDR